MLSLSRKTNYALTALGYLAERMDRVASAREIAEANHLPLPLLMNILKTLHQHGIVRSARGASGGYQISVDLEGTSLYRVVRLLEKLEPDSDNCHCGNASPAVLSGPVQAFHYKLRRFLKEVNLSDLVTPGRRIDVPLERILIERTQTPSSAVKALANVMVL